MPGPFEVTETPGGGDRSRNVYGLVGDRSTLITQQVNDRNSEREVYKAVMREEKAKCTLAGDVQHNISLPAEITVIQKDPQEEFNGDAQISHKHTHVTTDKEYFKAQETSKR